MKTTPHIRPTELDRAYLAGIIDGEGCIAAYVCTWTRPGKTLREDWIQLFVNVATTERRLIDWITARWAGSTCATKPNPPRQACYQFTAGGPALVPLLEAAMPYLVIKREQAEIALELHRSKRNPGRRGYPPEEKARRVALTVRMQELNRRGSGMLEIAMPGMPPRRRRTRKRTRLTNASPADRAYLAGLIDGEGLIVAYYCKYDRPQPGGQMKRAGGVQLCVDICNTDQRMIDWVAARWPGHLSVADRINCNHKPIHRFVVRNLGVAPFLEVVLPYLVIKRDQAEIALELAWGRTKYGPSGLPPEVRQQRRDLADRIQELNRRGSKPRGRSRRDTGVT